MGGTTALANVVAISTGESANYPGLTCALTTDHTVLCWGISGFLAYPTLASVTNVVALGTVEGYVNAERVRVLTSDGLYHIDNTTRTPNCGLIQ